MLRLSEHYVSVQGEGPNTGVPTQFVRFAGCNLRCPGWPCDTPHAIEPSIWRKESEKLDPIELWARIVEQYEKTGVKNICLTGGEPFMQKEGELKTFVTGLYENSYPFDVECFTNGSYVYPNWALDYVQLHMDWKLTGSGEHGKHEEVRLHNARRFGMKDTIKFVVTDQTDLRQAEATSVMLDNEGVISPLWIGAAWGRISDQEIIDFVIQRKLNMRLNVQMHKHIWDPNERKR